MEQQFNIEDMVKVTSNAGGENQANYYDFDIRTFFPYKN